MPVMRSSTTPDISQEARADSTEVWTFFAHLAVRAFTPELLDEARALAAQKPHLRLDHHVSILADVVACHVKLALREASSSHDLNPPTAKRALSLRASTARAARQAAARSIGPVRRSATAVGAIGCVPRARRAERSAPDLYGAPGLDNGGWATSYRELDLRATDFLHREDIRPNVQSEKLMNDNNINMSMVGSDDGMEHKRRSQGFSLSFARFSGLRQRRAEKHRIGRGKGAREELDAC